MKESPPRVTWQMFKNCNYDCSYCRVHTTNEGVVECLPIEIIAGVLKKLGKQWILKMTGGEPLLHPNFVELCKTITKTNKITLDTNLSLDTKVKNFSENIDPNNVYSIYAALHIEEREKRDAVESFIQNVLLLRKKHFNIRVNYIFLPTLKNKFLLDYEYFEKRGIILIPKPFKGIYNILTGKIVTKAPRLRSKNSFSNNNKEKKRKIIQILRQRIHKNAKKLINDPFSLKYPDSYSKEEMKIIMKFLPDAYLQTPFYSKGMKCSAGKTSLSIFSAGKVQRCTSDPTSIGNVLKSIKVLSNSEPCRVSSCLSFMGSDAEIPELKKRMNKLYQ